MVRWCLLICWTPLVLAQGDRIRAMDDPTVVK
jgi:hypothetical protein